MCILETNIIMYINYISKKTFKIKAKWYQCTNCQSGEGNSLKTDLSIYINTPANYNKSAISIQRLNGSTDDGKKTGGAVP